MTGIDTSRMNESRQLGHDIAVDLGDNIRKVVLAHIKKTRKMGKPTAAQKRRLILHLEAAVHAEVISALGWTLDRCSYHAQQEMTPGSAWTDEGEP